MVFNDELKGRGAVRLWPILELHFDTSLRRPRKTRKMCDGKYREPRFKPETFRNRSRCAERSATPSGAGSGITKLRVEPHEAQFVLW
jgi:hypothetical protein